MINKFHDVYFNVVAPWVEAHPYISGFIAGVATRLVF